jgi:CTP:molybdopterin cytidylyltransferase MocA
MGRAKQLIEVDGESMVRRAVKVALACGAHEVVLVTGAYADEVRAAVADLVGEGGALRLVHNAGWAAGQAGSVKAGLDALTGATGAAIFLPVDQPYMQSVLLQQLASAWMAGARLVAPRVDGEMRGAPALFDRNLWAELYQVEGDVGGRSLLRAHAGEVQLIDAPAVWLRDFDTPQDLGLATE